MKRFKRKDRGKPGNRRPLSRGRSGRRGSERSGGKERFSRRDSGKFSRRESGRSRPPKQMHTVTCDKCGKRCEVPFKPTSSKPVYCSDCFRKNEHSGSNKTSSGKEFDQINIKLDKILKALKIKE